MAVQNLTTASFDFLHKTEHIDYIMNTTDYWPFAREYSIWNATVATLQFWTADLEPHILSSTIEQVYTTFFYTTSMHLLHQQSEEVLFVHFVTMLNAAIERKLTLKDEGYESGSENFNIPTPFRWTPRIHHVSSDENISFNPSTHAPQLPTSHIASLYTVIYHSVALTMKKVPQFTFQLTTACLPPQNPMGIAQQPLSKYIYTMCDDLEEEDKDF